MAEKQIVRRIENKTVTWIILPPTPSFPSGLKLVPGLNTVPTKYLDELDERVLETEPTKRGGRLIPGKKVKPAQKMWERLTAPVHFLDDNGTRHYGPRVIFYDDLMEDRQDGPPPPVNLPANREIAKKIIDVTTEKAALERWASQGRGEIPDYAKARLKTLSEKLHG